MSDKLYGQKGVYNEVRPIGSLGKALASRPDLRLWLMKNRPDGLNTADFLCSIAEDAMAEELETEK